MSQGQENSQQEKTSQKQHTLDYTDLDNLFTQFQPQEMEQFYRIYQLWFQNRQYKQLQQQIQELQQRITENAAFMQQWEPSPLALAVLSQLQTNGVSDVDLLDKMLERGETWLDHSLQLLQRCEELDLIKGDYTQWCEHALEGAYEWIASMSEAEEDVPSPHTPTTVEPANEEQTAEPLQIATEDILLQKLMSDDDDEITVQSIDDTTDIVQIRDAAEVNTNTPFETNITLPADETVVNDPDVDTIAVSETDNISPTNLPADTHDDNSESIPPLSTAEAESEDIITPEHSSNIGNSQNTPEPESQEEISDEITEHSEPQVEEIQNITLLIEQEQQTDQVLYKTEHTVSEQPIEPEITAEVAEVETVNKQVETAEVLEGEPVDEPTEATETSKPVASLPVSNETEQTEEIIPAARTTDAEVSEQSSQHEITAEEEQVEIAEITIDNSTFPSCPPEEISPATKVEPAIAQAEMDLAAEKNDIVSSASVQTGEKEEKEPEIQQSFAAAHTNGHTPAGAEQQSQWPFTYTEFAAEKHEPENKQECQDGAEVEISSTEQEAETEVDEEVESKKPHPETSSRQRGFFTRSLAKILGR
ncbi:MAG TPA: hypothetical protein VL461_02590 [Dictyobacter sp.]|jgi:hypothetical protein|nr:hypothetical protein [Dictyobacter sp.]